jgi:hypothetical protein
VTAVNPVSGFEWEIDLEKGDPGALGAGSWSTAGEARGLGGNADERRLGRNRRWPARALAVGG